MIVYYKNLLNRWNNRTKKVRIEWQELQEEFNIIDYKEFAIVINELVANDILKPIGKQQNGRTPLLQKKYEFLKEEKDYSVFINEIYSEFSEELDKSFYLRNIESYIANRKNILAINNYIKTKKHLLKTPISINERSYEVFGKEKKLMSSNMNGILKNLGLEGNFFNYYKTTQPIAYYSVDKKTPQNILIVENKDTFYTIRKYIKDISNDVLGTNISTIIYGSGKGRLPSYHEMEQYTEDFILNKDNNFYYFGDLDYEGIMIYEGYRNRNIEKMEIKPFIKGYEYIIQKCNSDFNKLQFTKEGQKDNTKGIFLNYFNTKTSLTIEFILKSRKYIPQEALNYNDLLEHYKKGVSRNV